MATLRSPEPTILTTPKGEEVVLLTLTRSEWEALYPLLNQRAEIEKMSGWREDALTELAMRLENLEVQQTAQEKQGWQDAVAKAKPATYIPGQGVVVSK